MLPRTKDGGFKLDDSTLEPYKIQKEKGKSKKQEKKLKNLKKEK